MARCDRIYFATQQIAIADTNTLQYTAVRGAQTATIRSDTPLQEIFQLGKLQVYVQLESLPDINISVEKVLEGHPLIYHLATQTAPGPRLAERANELCNVALSVFASNQESATGVPVATVETTGAYYQQISYTFTTDGPFRESVQFVSNDLIVSNDIHIVNPTDQARSAGISVDGQFTGNDDPLAGVNQKEHLIFAYTASTLDANGQVADADATILPGDLDGITLSGTNELEDGHLSSNIQSITVSANINREQVDILGQLEPVCRRIQFPVEITTEIQVAPRTLALLSATSNGILNTGNDQCYTGPRNRREWTIRIAACEGTRIYTGMKNKLQSQNMSGGDAGGGHGTISNSYRTFNDFTVMHENDPNSSGMAWWASRNDYLVG